MFTRIINRASHYGIAFVFTKVISFLVYPIYFDIISIEQFGIFTSFLLISGILSIIYSFNGVNAIFGVDINNPLKIKLISSGAFTNNILIFSVIIILYYLLVEIGLIELLFESPHQYLQVSKLLIVLPIALFLQIFNHFNIILVILGKSKALSYIQLLKGILIIILNLVFLIFFEMEELSFVISLIIATSIEKFLLFYQLHSILSFRFSIKNSKALQSIVFYGGIKTVGTAILKKTDKLMLQKMIGVEALGIYEIIMRLYNIVDGGQAIFKRSYIPEVQKDVREILIRNTKIHSKHQKIMLAIVSVNIFLFTLFYFFGYSILQAISNNLLHHEDAMVLIIWLLVPIVSQSIAYYSLILLIDKIYHAAAVATISGGLINIGLNLLLIPIYGIPGAAIASVFSIIIECLAYWAFGVKKYGRIYPIVENYGMLCTAAIITLLLLTNT